MPIAPEHRRYYGVEWRTVIRPRILARAKDCCENCGRKNGTEYYPHPWDKEPVRVQLGVCHFNHQPGDDRDENLFAWCRRCHLRHDLQLHLAHARETRMQRKDAARPLLRELVAG